MAKKMQKRVTVCGVEFYGSTIAEAKAAGDAAISRFVDESRQGPSVYRVGKMTVLVWAELQGGWSYTIQGGEAHKPGGLARAMCSSHGTREEVTLSAVGHAAQWQWTHDVQDDVAYFQEAFSPLLAASGMGQAVDRAVTDYAERQCWQRRWLAANDICGDREVARDIATRTATIDEARASALFNGHVA